MINLKRAYDPVASTDGTRFLVERLWPRGVKKTALHVHAWLKDVAPSTILKLARRSRVTLVYSSHEMEHNNAVALKDYLQARIGKKRGPHKVAT